MKRNDIPAFTDSRSEALKDSRVQRIQSLSRSARPNDQAQPRRVSGVGWSVLLCCSRFDTFRWASELLLSTRLALAPQLLSDGLDVVVEASSKILAPAPGFFDDWVLPHGLCLDESRLRHAARTDHADSILLIFISHGMENSLLVDQRYNAANQPCTPFARRLNLPC